MKKKLHFGRVCAMLAIAACAQSVNGQILKLESSRGPGLVPASMTIDGKPRITTKEDDGIHIYNTDFIQERVVNYSRQTYRRGNRTEQGEVTVTGAEISSFNIYSPYYFSTEASWGYIEASTLEEAREKLATMLGNNYIVKIYEIDGYVNNLMTMQWVRQRFSFIHYYFKNADGFPSSDYYISNLSERAYPISNTYALSGGKLCSVNISYSPLYDENSTVWSVTEDYTSEYDAEIATDIRYKNADTGTVGEDLEICFTQTVFNNDEKWEYVETKYEANALEIHGIGTSEVSVSNDGKVTISRNVQVFTPVTGLRIVSEDGTVVATISAEHANTPESFVSAMSVRGIWRINGKYYIETSKSLNGYESGYESYCAIYQVGEGTNGVRKVIEYETGVEPDNTIYDLSGRVLTEKPATGIYIQGGKKYLVQ